MKNIKENQQVEEFESPYEDYPNWLMSNLTKELQEEVSIGFDLTEIMVGDTSLEIVDARALHQMLGVGDTFAKWIKRCIAKYNFIENQDYMIVVDSPLGENPQQGNQGLRDKIDYHITSDMAKELCMVENNEIGRKVRLYFIQAEKKLKAILALRLELAEENALCGYYTISEMTNVLRGSCLHNMKSMGKTGYNFREGTLNNTALTMENSVRLGRAMSGTLPSYHVSVFEKAYPNFDYSKVDRYRPLKQLISKDELLEYMKLRPVENNLIARKYWKH